LKEDQRPDRSGDDRAFRQAQREIGQLTMKNEILWAAETKGAADPAGEAAQIAMAQQLPVAMACGVLGAAPLPDGPRRGRLEMPARPGPATTISDIDLLGLIRRILYPRRLLGRATAKNHQMNRPWPEILHPRQRQGITLIPREQSRGHPASDRPNRACAQSAMVCMTGSTH
jgi:hypothetical protein